MAIDIINTADSISTATYSITSRFRPDLLKLLEKIDKIDDIEEKVDELIEDDIKVDPHQILWIDSIGTHHTIDDVQPNPEIDVFNSFKEEAVEVYLGYKIRVLPEKAFALFNSNNEIRNNTKLKKISGKGVIEIGYQCFYGCTLLNNISLPILKTIHDSAFMQSGIEEAYFPYVTRLESYAFAYCENLKNVDLSSLETLITLEYIFTGCINLYNIKLPNLRLASVRGLFNECNKLLTIELPKLTDVNQYLFYGCKANTINLQSVTSISAYAFNNNLTLEYIYAPNVTSVGESAFMNCSNLKKIEMYKLTSILDNTFLNCNLLSDVNLPNAEIIHRYAFHACTSLKSILLPRVTEIKPYAFKDCTALECIYAPSLQYLSEETVDSSLQNCAFCNTSLRTIYFPYLKTIGGLAFQDCKQLEIVNIPNAIRLGDNCFDGCTTLSEICFTVRELVIIPECTADTFVGTNTDQYVIIVPDNLYNDWSQSWKTLNPNLNIIPSSNSRSIRKNEIEDIIRVYIETHILAGNRIIE